TVTYSSIAIGSHSITAAYGGDGSFNDSNNTASPLIQAVAYGIKLLYDPTKSVNAGSIVQIKVALIDTTGHNLSSAAVVLTAIGISPIAPGVPTPTGTFTFISTLNATGGYQYKLKTVGLTAGPYNLLFTVGGDPTIHRAPFRIG